MYLNLSIQHIIFIINYHLFVYHEDDDEDDRLPRFKRRMQDRDADEIMEEEEVRNHLLPSQPFNSFGVNSAS